MSTELTDSQLAVDASATLPYRRWNMGYKNYCLVSGAVFSLVALAHLLRIAYNMPATIDDFAVPMLASWIGLILPAVLAVWAFRTSSGSS